MDACAAKEITQACVCVRFVHVVHIQLNFLFIKFALSYKTLVVIIIFERH